MDKIFIVILLIFLLSNLFSQTEIDSLEAKLNFVSGSDRIPLLNKLAIKCAPSSPTRTIQYGEEALKLSREIGDKEQEISSHNSIAGGYFILRNYDKALEIYETCVIEAEKLGFEEGLQDYYFNIGHIYKRKHDFPRSLEFYQKSLSLRQKLGDQDRIAKVLHTIGVTYWYLSNFKEALKYYAQEIEIFRALDDKLNIALCLNNIANSYIKLGDYESSLENYLESLQIREELGDKKMIANALTSLGNFFWMRENNESALDYHLKALNLYESDEINENLPAAYNSIGLVYDSLQDYENALKYYLSGLEIGLEIGDKKNSGIIMNNLASFYLDENKIEKALEYYLRSLKIKKEINDKSGIAETSKNIGFLFLQKQEYKKAFEYLQKGFDIAAEIDDMEILMQCYQGFSDYFDAIGNSDKAFENYKNYISIKDSIFTIESNKHILEIQTKYETEKKEKEIEILTKNNEIQQLVLNKQKLIRNIFIAGFVLIFFIGFIFYKSKQREIKIQKRVEEEIKNLNKELEKRVEEELQKRQEQQQLLIQKSKLESLGKLSAGIAHEINQPLGGISMGLENIYFTFSEDQLTQDYFGSKIQTIKGYIERINKIINHIRIFSRDQKSVIFEKIDLNEVVKNALSMVQTQYENHQIKLELLLDEKLGFTKGNLYKLEQVTVNLLSNAKDAVEEKEMLQNDPNFQKKIKIKSYFKPPNICLEIEDNGKGISSENIDKIFDPFFTTKDPEKGTGLGLSIVYGIIKEMNGDIKVESEINKFSKFKIILPKV
ncbi:MAG: tetratricopeptide repeat protein [Candidatus Cloacimonetes bacterium]|nr:tetratricopeptide repeat protein [Candidatus Cloacimonadota bacterium]